MSSRHFIKIIINANVSFNTKRQRQNPLDPSGQKRSETARKMRQIRVVVLTLRVLKAPPQFLLFILYKAFMGALLIKTITGQQWRDNLNGTQNVETITKWNFRPPGNKLAPDNISYCARFFIPLFASLNCDDKKLLYFLNFYNFMRPFLFTRVLGIRLNVSF